MDGNSSDFLGDFMFHGVINIYKEPGFTSHDVVAKLRGILRQKKIGHTGTLDPAAEGVLPVCLGKGTKLAKDNVPDIWGKIARDCYFPERCGKVVGFGYDYGDYYLIIEQSDGTESTILMNSHYIVE